MKRTMKKAVFYKEWIKTRYFIYLSFLLSWCFTGYSLMKISRVIRLRGEDHLWQVMLERDAIFIDLLTFMPLAVGILLAAVQFIPEMQQSRFKLTLHLPYPQFRMAGIMLSYGVLVLTAVFISNQTLAYLFLDRWLPAELLSRLFFTALPWQLAGISGYLLTAWICLEPAWKRRLLDLSVSAGVIRLFFLSPVPEAYNRFLPVMILYIPFISLLPMLSVSRFKAGVQD